MNRAAFSKHLQDWLIGAGVLAVVASLIGFAGRFGWIFELASHFRVQYFLFLTLIALVCVALRRPAAAAGFALAATVNLMTILPLYQGAVGTAVAAAPGLRVLSLNVNYKSQSYAKVRALIAAYRPDLILLQEITPGWLAELQTLQAEYPYTVGAARLDPYGIALFSRLPLSASRIERFGGNLGRPAVIADIDADGRRFTLVGAHPPPPINPRRAALRNEQLAEIARLVRGNALPAVLVGDLNTSPWSYYFTRLLREAGLQDSSRGRGVMASWPSGYPLFWIPIDHCLVSRDIAVIRKEIGPAVGSDHYPLIVDIAPAGRS